MSRLFSLGLGVVIGLWAAASRGDESAARLPAAGDLSIQSLIEELEAPAFGARQAASHKLAEAGLEALPALEQAAAAERRETVVRALEVIKRHLGQGDPAVRDAARAALGRLAKSTQPAVAQRARDVLNPPAKPSILPATPVGLVNPGFRGPNFQFQFGAPGAARRRVSVVRDAGGVHSVEVEEPGRTMKIQAQPGGGIALEITEQRNGQNLTRRIDAANLDELRRRDAEAARLFEQYSQLPARPGAGAPVPPPPPGFAPGGRPAQPADLAALRRMLESLDASIDRLTREELPDANRVRTIDALQRMRQHFAERLRAGAEK